MYGQAARNNTNKNNIRSQRESEIRQSPDFKVDIPNNNEFNLLTVADWGPIHVREYQPIYPSLLTRLNKEKIHGMLIIGDIAYDLSTN